MQAKINARAARAQNVHYPISSGFNSATNGERIDDAREKTLHMPIQVATMLIVNRS